MAGLFYFSTSLLLFLVAPPSTSPENHPPVRWTKCIFDDLKHQPDFMSVNHQICPKLGQDVKLLMVVLSAVHHQEARLDIRKTWGQYAMRKDVALAFMLGTTSDFCLNEKIKEENDLYNDIIRVNFVDTFYNLTLKTMSILMWTQKYCPKASFLLKVDDDVYINHRILLPYIDKLDWNKRAIYGSLIANYSIMRDPKKRFYISREQYESNIPFDAILGPSYLMPIHIVKALYEKAFEYKYIPVEDIFITGIVAEKLKIDRVSERLFDQNYFNKKTVCSAQNEISIHNVSHLVKYDLWVDAHYTAQKCQ